LSSKRTRLEKFNQLLEPENLVLFLRIMVSIPVFRFLVGRMEMPDLVRRLDGRSPERMPLSEKDCSRAELASRYANFLLITCLRLKNPCLLRSLIIFHMLRRKGLDARIHFGVKRDGADLAGHSWLSLGGRCLLEGKDHLASYVEMYSYPHANS
jgi:hypothetical protein